MPEQKRGADKFAVEHAVNAGKKRLSAREVRQKAAHYRDQSDY
jgi:hypothetical protein